MTSLQDSEQVGSMPTPDLLEEFDWIVYNRFYHKYPGASHVVGSAEISPITREEAALPAENTREYRAFKRWQRGGLVRRATGFIIDIVSARK